MTVHKIQRLQPNLINYNVLANNGEVPGAAFWRRLAQALNHWAAYQKKTFLMISDDMQGLTAGSATTVATCHAAGATGHGTNTLVALVGLARPDNASAVEPGVQVQYRVHGDTSWSTAGTIRYYGGTASNPVKPKDIHHAAVHWDADPNTHYEFRLRVVDYARVVYCTITERHALGGVDDTERGIVDPSAFVGEGDIEDAAIQDLIEAANDLMRHNRAHLHAWTRTDVLFPTTSSGSYANIMSDSVLRLDLSSHASANRQVPVVFGAQVDPGAVVSGGVRIRNTTDGSTVAEITNMVPTSDSDWIKTTAWIDPDDIDGDDLEVQAVSDGSNSFEVRGVTLYEYEHGWSPTLTHSLDLEADSSQYLSITDANQSGILDVRTNLTIECSVKFESLPASGNEVYLVSKFNTTGDQRSYVFYLHNDSGTQKLRALLSGNGTSGTTHGVEATWSGAGTGSWVHFAMTWDPQGGAGVTDQFALYVDGSSQTVASLADNGVTSIHSGSADFRIGAIHGGDTLDGKICDVRLWREVRTAAEISANYNRDVQLHAGLVWHGLKTNTADDETDHGNDLTENGSPSYSTDTPY